MHFFWGSFDLAVTRFSGRPAPPRAEADTIQREAYSHEVISAGFWPGNGGYGAAAFYCYAAPVPEGLAEAKIRPDAAGWDKALGEFIFKYDAVRAQALPGDGGDGVSGECVWGCGGCGEVGSGGAGAAVRSGMSRWAALRATILIASHAQYASSASSSEHRSDPLASYDYSGAAQAAQHYRGRVCAD